jgi:hypothetical protein
MSRSTVSGEAGTRNGKTHNEMKSVNIEPSNDEHIPNIAARIPDISLA